MGQYKRKLVWIIQDCYEFSKDLAAKVTENDYDVILADNIPPSRNGFYFDNGKYFDFSKNFLDFQNFPVVLHGSIRFIQTVHNQMCLYPGLFADFSDYNFSAYAPYIHKFLLNNDYVLVPSLGFVFNSIDDYLRNVFKTNQLFVKPDKSDKAFTGRLFNFNDSIISNVTGNLVVSSPKIITSEYRVLFVEKRPITYSLYSGEQEREQKEIFNYCEMICNILPPKYDTFTIDVCVSENKINVVELNSFSAAGLYDCDLNKVAQEISLKAFSEYNELF